MSGLRFGPLPAATFHLCVDMQRMFAAGTSWASDAVARVLPATVALTRAMPERTIFTRFVTPQTPEAATGTWRRYYERWRDVVQDRMAPALLDLVPELAAFVPPARIVDKPTYSAFAAGDLPGLLRDAGAEALIITGVETEICVNATLMGAIDAGYRCIIAREAVWSPDPAAHAFALDLLFRRLSDHVEVVALADLLP